MKFTDITSAINEAWKFCWPPVVAIAVAYVVARFVYPSGVNQLVQFISAIALDKATALNDLRVALRPFGLVTLIPVVSFIVVIAFLYIVNVVVQQWVGKLPPAVACRAEQLLCGLANEKEQEALLRKYHTAPSVAAACSWELGAFQRANKDSPPPPYENYVKLHNFLKFAIVVMVVVFIVAGTRHDLSFSLVARSLVVIALSAVLWGLGLFGYLCKYLDHHYSVWCHIRTGLQDEAGKLLVQPASEEEEERLTRPSFRKSWWFVRPFDFNLRWYSYALSGAMLEYLRRRLRERRVPPEQGSVDAKTRK